MSREKIERGAVPKHVALQVDPEHLEFWKSLTGEDRMIHYDDAIYEHRIAHAWQNGFLGSLLGQGVAEGRGGCLVNAIRNAYDRV